MSTLRRVLRAVLPGRRMVIELSRPMPALVPVRVAARSYPLSSRRNVLHDSYLHGYLPS